jgi:enoyl-CoA hydratase/carnithine racemase
MNMTDDIITECAEGILRVELNRPEKLNAMTSSMYTKLAEIFNDAAQDDRIRVVLWHGAGDAFSAGNDVKDFLKNPPGSGESPQARLMNALVGFDKPLIAAVCGAAIGGGTTMLLHCDFVYSGESTRFQMPFINFAVVPEFGSTSFRLELVTFARLSLFYLDCRSTPGALWSLGWLLSSTLRNFMRLAVT